jgi:hypothetical protein
VNASNAGEPDAGMAVELVAGNEAPGVGLGPAGSGVSCVVGADVGPVEPAVGVPAAVIEGAVAAVTGAEPPDRPRA